ncbi:MULTISPECIES: DUF4124 domain-containing protein [Deefgea]|uniref:DUF4124 domain-containing protein n=1 Tax=Deefgea chitinilytica TaxID=570276 RepID=A0ABS2C905_9NEIS|nr:MULTISPECIES: DUF4124 domain-containing protein [Deefgea]MBM5570115.1 DUF4124 domain-containing protein [Deefgea chitinilytica]
MYAKIFFSALLISSCAMADIYKYTDENGNVTFTNSPIKGAVRIMSESNPTTNARRPGGDSSNVGKSPRVAAPSPLNFPKVDAATQKSRDSNRKVILTEELNNERTLLSKAQRSLQEAETTKTAAEQANPRLYLERIARLRETIMMHEKNVAALQSEINRVR